LACLFWAEWVGGGRVLFSRALGRGVAATQYPSRVATIGRL